MATHSSIVAWRIPGTGEPGGLPSMGSHRVGHDWSNLAAAAAAQQQLYLVFPGGSRGKESTCQCTRCRFSPWVGKVPWRRKWQPTPVFLPGKSLEQRSLASYSPWGCKRVRHDLETTTTQPPRIITKFHRKKNVCYVAEMACGHKLFLPLPSQLKKKIWFYLGSNKLN